MTQLRRRKVVYSTGRRSKRKERSYRRRSPRRSRTRKRLWHKHPKIKKSKQTRSSRWKYLLWNTCLFTLSFIAVYKIWLEPLPNNWEFLWIIPFNPKFLMIFLWNLGLGLGISWGLRVILHYYGELLKPVNDLVRNLFQSLIYAGLIWAGMFTYFFETREPFIAILDLLIVKAGVFLLADFIGDYAGFGG